MSDPLADPWFRNLVSGNALDNETVPQAAPEGSGDDWLYHELVRERNVQTSLRLAQASDPDKEAQANILARNRGVPAATIDPAQARSIAGNDNAAFILSHYPAVCKWTAQNPRGAVAASDDLHHLGLLDRFLQAAVPDSKAPKGLLEGALDYVSSIVNPLARLGQAADMLGQSLGYEPGDITNAAKASALSATASIAKGVGVLGDIQRRETQLLLGDGWLANAAQHVLNPLTLPGSEATAPLSGALDRQGKLLESKVAQHGYLATTAGLVGGLLPYAVGGEAAPVLMGLSGAGQQEAAAEQQGKAGTPEADAAVLGGAVFMGALGTLVGGGKLAEMIPEQQVIKTVGGTFVPNLWPWLASAAGKVVARVTGDAAVGAAMQGGSNVITHLTVNPDQPLGEGVGESAVQMALLGQVMHAVDVAGAAAAQRYVDAATGAAQANIADALNLVAEASKLRERDPENWKSYLQAVTEEHGAPDSVYVSPAAFAEAMKTPDGQAALAQMPETVRDAINVASKSGGDVKLPVDEFGTWIAGTPVYPQLADHLKFSPDTYTRAEAADIVQTEGPRVLAELDRAINARSESDAFTASRTAVEQQIRGQLDATGTGTPEVNAINAKLGAASIATFATRTGMTPEEFFAQHGFRVTSELQPQGPALEQPSVAALQADLAQRGIDTAISEHGGVIRLSKIVVPEDMRGQGQGTAAMQALTDYADIIGKRIALTPSTDFGASSKRRLRDFYKRFGFVDNKGRSRDLSVSEEMIREPKVLNQLPATIEHNGIERPTVSSEGRPLATTEEGVRRFWDWFGDSKVVDAQGRPIILYKGGPVERGGPVYNGLGEIKHEEPLEAIEVFNSPGGPFAGFFTDDPQVASRFAEVYSDRLREGTSVGSWPVYVSMHHPYVIDMQGRHAAAAQFNSPMDGWSDAAFRAALSDPAYDGVVLLNTQDEGNVYIPKDGPQIKSINNRGTFDPADPRILFQAQETDQSRWARTVDAVIRGDPIPGAILHLGSTPAVLREMGLPTGDLRMVKSKLAKARRDHPEVPLDVWRRLPSLIADPRAVFPSGKPDGSVVVAIEAKDADGQPVIVPIIASAEGGNVVLSVYGRDPQYITKGIARARKDGQAVYVREGLADALVADDNRAPPPRHAPNAPEVPTKPARKILSRKDVVKKYEHTYNREARGQFLIDSNTINLLKNANLSTFIHELGHYNLESLARFAPASEAIARDFAATLHWLSPDLTPEKWDAMSLEERRPFHEKFAQGFEKYLFEGKAPAEGLRGVFQRAAAWLKHVYGALTNLGVELSPEVRQVMDRLVATDEEIAQAEQRQGYRPAFAVKPEAMSDAQWEAYQALGQQATMDAQDRLNARSLRDLQWFEGAKSRELKRLQGEHKALRDAVRDEVSAEVMGQPVNRMREFVRFGRIDGEAVEGPHKLSIEEVRALYPLAGEEFFKRLGYGKTGMLGKENAIHPEQVADQFGYASAREMIADHLAQPKPKDAIALLTDQRMLERHGDLNDPRRIEQAAMEAVHNAARGRMLEAEYSALAKATGRKGELGPAAKAMAAEVVGKLRVNDVRPERFRAEERRAGERAERAIRANDLETAAAEKRNQLLNFHLARAADQASGDLTKALDYFRRVQKKSAAKAMGGEAAEQIDTLLDRFDLRQSTTLKQIAARKTLIEWANEQAAQGLVPAIDPKLLHEANRQAWKDLTVTDALALRDAVRSIDAIGRKQTEITLGERRVALDTAVAEMLHQTADMGGRKPPDVRNPEIGGKGFDRIDAAFLRSKSFIRMADAALLKMEQMFDWLDRRDATGVFNRTVFRPLADAQGRENDMLADLSGRLKALGESLSPEARSGLVERFTLPELIDSRTGKPSVLAKSQILSIALNAANESNFAKLLAGEGWDRDAAMGVLSKHLTAEDIAYVNGVIRIVESLWPQIEALEKRLSGVAPKKIEGRPLDLANGRIEGGYFPVVYDPTRSFNARRNAALDTAKGVEDLYAPEWSRPSTFHGHTIKRSNYDAPILLSLDVIPRHLAQVAHDIAYREAVINADRFIRDARVRDEIARVLGPEYYDEIPRWLRAIATDRVYDGQGQAWMEKIAHWGRTGMTMMGLGFRASTIMVHGTTAASNSVAEIGSKWFTKGLAAFASPDAAREAHDFVTTRSAEMRHRMDNIDRDIHDQLREMQLRASQGRLAPVARAIDQGRRLAFYGIGAVDMASALPTWMGAYLKAMETAENGGLGMGEADAIYYADKAVRNAHGGGGIKDLARVQRGSQVEKLFTMFYSFWNHIYNRQRDLGRLVTEIDSADDLANVIARSWFYLVIPQLLHAVLKTPSQQEEDEEGGVEAWAKWAGEEIALGLTSGVPILRDIANTVIAGHDYTATPVERTPEAIIREGGDIGKAARGKETPNAIAHAADAASLLFHLPLSQAGRTGQFLWDVIDGEQKPEDLGDWWSGLIYGHVRK